MSLFFPHCCIVTPTLIADAKTAANNIPLLKNSIRGGGGTFVGCLGEQALMTFLPGSILDSTYEHDVLWDELTIECKTKDRTGPPKAYYNASVANFNTTQQADLYAFMSAERIEGTDNYIKVYTKNSEDLTNKLLPVKLVKIFNQEGVWGEVAY